jgi:TP901 family phage tail tape measure protein
MADVQSNIHVNIDTSDALASLKLLQRQISAFHTQMSKSGAAASAVAANQAQNLMNSINATGKFQATMRTVATSTEYFTNALEKNKLTSREYFRYTGAATKTFGRLFKSEFETINKVARERVKDIQTQYIKMGRGANGALQAIAVRPLTLDMKNLATQTQIAAQRQQLLNQLLKQGSTNLLNFGKNTQWAGRQLMVGFTVPLMLLGSTAAKTFMKLEEQAIRFKRVYGEMFTTQEETDAMVKQIQTLAKEYTKYGVAVEKTMEMAANAAAMGKMGAELTAQVTEATRLAVLGGVEQEQALETTISVTNAFGVAAEDLAKKIDFLNAVENQTVVSIEDLTIAIPKAGPVVQQLGGDVEDLAFFLTAMKEGGINASEGANALKSGLASLINPSEKASKMLGGLGINIKGIVEANKGDVAATVVGFAQALDTLDPLNRARAIEQLFGKFQFSRLSTLFQNVTAQGSQAARVLGLTRATTEELAILSQRELDKIEDTTTYKFKKAIEDLKVTLAPVGEQFLKALTPIVEFASKILDKFNNLGEGSKKFLTILTVALGAIGPIALMTFGLLANGLANIIKLFATMKTSFNRAGSSTQILGNQTDYLTQQQLEASAVAASLDQVHQKLRQTFTSETAAVNALAAAYQSLHN